MLKILAIGNSYSQDTTRYLQDLNKDLFVRSLYIGGCSLETHFKNLLNDLDAYHLLEDGESICENYSIKRAVEDEKWDIVTLQQVSYLAGEEKSYYPSITYLLEYLKEKLPFSKIYLHETWAYNVHCEKMSNQFALYDYNQKKMDDKIYSAVRKVSKRYDLPLIKVGEFIKRLRSVKPFSNDFNRYPLYRDAIHLNEYGRYAGALVWNYTFTDKISEIIPEGLDAKTCEIIKNEFKKFVKKEK